MLGIPASPPMKRNRNQDIYSIIYIYSMLAGGFNPSEIYQSNWIIPPSRGEHKALSYYIIVCIMFIHPQNPTQHLPSTTQNSTQPTQPTQKPISNCRFLSFQESQTAEHPQICAKCFSNCFTSRDAWKDNGCLIVVSVSLPSMLLVAPLTDVKPWDLAKSMTLWNNPLI